MIRVARGWRMTSALMALALLVAAPSLAMALGVNEVARELRCPTCATPLDVSNAPVAQDMKAQIADRIDRGWSKEQIIDEFVAEFGETVLATPPKRGFDLLAWLVPALAVAVGLGAIPLVMRAWARRGHGDGSEGLPPPSPEEARRLDDELRRLGDV